MGLVWKKRAATPKILFHARFPEYTPNDVADPAIVDAAISAGALFNGLNDFNPSLRDVLNPGFRDGSNPTADSFQRLTYGGFLLRQGLSQSVPTRVAANRTMERSLLFDISHPDAFRNNGKFHTALLDEADFALNRPAFREMGFSRGLNYNIYCNARVTLADGRVYVFGGHDMQSQNGLYKMQIFDPEEERWLPRARPCTRDNWARDPFGTQLFASDPNARFFTGCDPLQIRNTQPPDRSDMKYARWYPSAVPLPDNTILVVAGTDQDASAGPDPQAADKGRQGIPQADAAFSATRVTQTVPEVYDPEEDRSVPLENARKTFPLYPQLEVVQTGPGRNDWMVCSMGGLDRVRTPVPPGGDRFTGPQWSRDTWCLDVRAALRDPMRGVAAENHWKLLATAAETRPYCCPTASLIEIDKDGHTVSHRWFMISGRNAAGAMTSTIEVIDFTDPAPQWRKAGDLIQPSNFSKAVLLPDGKVFIGQGLFSAGATFEERAGVRFQIFDPETGTTMPMTRTTVSRGLHGTATLLPDGTVFVAGENREALIRADDPTFPQGICPRPDPDLGLPNGQIFRPPYLFKNDGGMAMRPVIAEAPFEIDFRGHFDIKTAGAADQVGSVVLLRSDHNTHSFTSGDRHVKLAFQPKGPARNGELRVRAPRLPAQAIPGVYMLFVVDKNGVPSMGRQVRLKPDNQGSDNEGPGRNDDR